MTNRKVSEYRRFRENEHILSMALVADAAFFLIYLLAAGLGATWLKVVLSIAAIVVSLVCLVSLYLTGEIRRRRSRYLVAGFSAIVVCILVSLLVNYPSPSMIMGAAAK